MEKICNLLDETVLELFQVLEDLYDQQSKLEEAMKDGFLNISRARYSIGVKRICADQFIDADLKAVQTVSVNTDSITPLAEESADLESLSFALKKDNTSIFKLVSSQDEKDEGTDSILGCDIKGDESISEKKDEGLRQRKVDTSLKEKKENLSVSENLNKENEKKKPLSGEQLRSGKEKEDGCTDSERIKKRFNPLSLFGVLVPQTLRNGQARFQDAVELSVSVAGLKCRLQFLQDQIRNLKQRKNKLLSSVDSVPHVNED